MDLISGEKISFYKKLKVYVNHSLSTRWTSYIQFYTLLRISFIENKIVMRLQETL